MKPTRIGGRPGYSIYITKHGKRTARGLATTDPEEAARIVADYERLEHEPELLQTNDPARLLTFHPRAVELHLGDDTPIVQRLRELVNPQAALTTADLSRAEQLAREAVAAVRPSPAVRAAAVPADLRDTIASLEPKHALDGAAPEDPFLQERFAHQVARLKAAAERRYQEELDLTGKAIKANLSELLPEKLAYLNQQNATLQRELGKERQLRTDLEAELARLRRETNRHVTITLDEAIKAYANSTDFAPLALKTKREMSAVWMRFQATLTNPEHFKLADLRASHIQNYLDKLPNSQERCSLRTIAKHRQYIHAIVTCLYRRYDLAQNPADKLSPGRAPTTDRQGITAIRQQGDVAEMLSALVGVGDIHYWQALVAVAVLAGPRYSELIGMRIGDVDLDQQVLRFGGLRDDSRQLVRRTKTGRQRLTPIEQTVLKDILVNYVGTRQKLRTEATAGSTWANDWLFPSIVQGNPHTPRRNTLPGLWSDSSTFLRNWRKVAAAASQATGQKYYWEMGPKEWRHSAATIMGASGIDAERGSAWLGNSPTVWRNHYCRPSTSGHLWPFLYGRRG